MTDCTVLFMIFLLRLVIFFSRIFAFLGFSLPHFLFFTHVAGGDGVVQVAIANEAPLESTRKTYMQK